MIFLQYFCLRPSDSSDGMELRKEEVCLRKRAGSRASRTLDLTSGKCFRFRLSKRFSHLYQQHQIFCTRASDTNFTLLSQPASALQRAFSSEPSNTPPGRLNSKVTRRITSRRRLCCTSPGESSFKSQKKTRMSFKLTARAVAVFSLPIRSGLSFWSLSRTQAPQRLFTGTFNYSASTEQQKALEERRAKWREWARSRRERLKSDPEAYEKVRQKGREYCQKLWATDESTRKKRTLCNWVIRVVANGTQVDWTTHEAVITTERVEHDCATCHRPYHNGVKLWYV